MRVNCHLTFDGDCEAAFRTYERLLDAKIVTLVRFGESPLALQVPFEWQQRILHATLSRDGQELLLGNDAFPGAYERPQGFTATLGISGIARAKEIFDALSESGRVQMQFQETFWSAGYGQLVDRFGVPWEVNCEQPPASR